MSAPTGREASAGPGRGIRVRTAIGACLVATMIATAADLSLSAVHGYSLRLDRALLLLWVAAGLCAGAASVLVAIAIARRTLRSVLRVPPMPVFECLLAAVAPLAILTVRHHREGTIVVAVAVIGLALIVLAIAEALGKIRLATPALAIFGVVASIGGIAAAIAIPLPGRGMIPAANAAQSPAPSGPNLVMIVLDTLRADHIGTYGYSRPVTPWLDDFAKDATVYERAVSPSSYTLPSHATLFTGLYPETHGAVENDRDDGTSLEKLGLLADFANVSPLPEAALTLAEMMRERGYETGAICANSAYLSRVFNLDQGFETYVDATGSREAWRPAGLLIAAKFPMPQKWRLYRMMGSNERYYLFAHEINALTYQWMRGRTERPFFLFLNYMEAHAPHMAMPGYRDFFPSSYVLQTADWGAVNRGEQDFPPEQKAALVDAYDAQVRSLDDRLSELFERLKSAGALENTLVVICSDHGEGFNEHGTLGHAVSVFEPEVWVPLVVKRPGQTAGSRVSKLVGMADVAPTVLAALGLPVPDAIEGVDLTADTRKIPIVSYLGPYERRYTEHAVYSDPWKLLVRSDAAPRLFNIREDGGETQDHAGDEPDRVTELLSLLETYSARPGNRLQGDVMVMDDETRERLKSVGYGDAH